MNNTSLDLVFGGTHQVRIVLDDLGAPWWVAKDVCEVLGIQNPSDTLRKGLDEDERGVATVYTPSGEQQMLTVNESGLYALIFRSRKRQAKDFRKWVTSEVLPEIRRRGSFGNMEAVQELLVKQNALLARQDEDRKYWLARDTATNDRLNRQAQQLEELQRDVAGVRQPKAIGHAAGQEIRRRLKKIAWRQVDLDPANDGLTKGDRTKAYLSIRRRLEDKLRRIITFPRDTGNRFDRLASDRSGLVHEYLNTLETEADRDAARKSKASRERMQQKLFEPDPKPN